MTWNYRLVKTVHASGDAEYHVCEMYYDEKGNIESWSDPIPPYGETPEELEDDLRRMLGALSRPVLLASDLPEGVGTHG